MTKERPPRSKTLKALSHPYAAMGLAVLISLLLACGVPFAFTRSRWFDLLSDFMTGLIVLFIISCALCFIQWKFGGRSAPHPLDRVLRCHACGYTMHGLNRKTIACPECGVIRQRPNEDIEQALEQVDYQPSSEEPLSAQQDPDSSPGS